jgi:hypothetical protein
VLKLNRGDFYVFQSAREVDLDFQLAGDLARALRVDLDFDAQVDWAKRVVPRVVELFALDELQGQLDFFDSWRAVLRALPARLLSRLSTQQLLRIGQQHSAFWKASTLVGYLDEWAGVEYVPERFNPLLIPPVRPSPAKVASDRPREKLPVDPVPAAIAAPSGSSAGRLTGLALLQALPQWTALLPAAQEVFTFMYRRADRRKTPAQPWCEVSVGLLMKVTGYSQRQSERALAELRRGRWIGYIVRGRPQIGGSRYWVATSPFQLGDAALRSLVSKFGFKP